MNYLCHAFTCLFLLLLQTTAPGRALPVLSQYDLLAPYILFLGLFRPLREGLIVAFVCGIFMDLLWGGPTGLLVAAYLWIFTASRWIPRYVHVLNPFFLIAICMAAIVIEHIFMWMATALVVGPFPYSGLFLGRMIKSALCAGITGPVLILFQNQVMEWEAKRRADGERLV